MEALIEKANILIEALPYIRRFSGKTVVVKYGGAAMTDPLLREKFFEDITLLKYVGVNPIIVHGGGAEINKTLEALCIEPQFVGGLRVTDEKTMEVVQMVLVGNVNKEIVAGINRCGGNAIGLCGIDGSIITAHKKAVENGIDLGNVGEIDRINTSLLTKLASDEYIPVIAPIGVGERGESYNINADTVAGEVARALAAEKLMFLTDIEGIYLDENDPDSLLSSATISQIDELISSGKISGGMIPKVTACTDAIKSGVSTVHILNGKIEHPLLLEIFTVRGIGTMVTK